MMNEQDYNHRVQDLRDMKIHEFRVYGTWLYRYKILRVPRGWIFSVRWLWRIETIFVGDRK